MNTSVIQTIRHQGIQYFTALRPRQLHLLAVLIPTLLVFGYRFLIESDRFAAETQIVVMSNEANVQDKLGLGLLAGNAGQYQDSRLVTEFIHSIDMLRYLQDKIKVLDHFRKARL